MTPVPVRDPFFAGLLLPLEAALFLLRTPGVKRFAILPLLCNFVLYTAAVAIAVWSLWHWEVPNVAWDFWGGRLAEAVNAIGESLKLALGLPLVLIVAVLSFNTVGMVLASPLNDLLPERVERSVATPRLAAGLPLRLLLRATLGSIRESLRLALQQCAANALMLPLLLIPGLGWLAYFVVNAWFTGRAYFESATARNFLSARHCRPAIHAEASRLFGLGVMMQALFLIPGLGLLVLPLGVTAGTLLYCGIDWEALFEAKGLDRPEGWTPRPTAG